MVHLRIERSYFIMSSSTPIDKPIGPAMVALANSARAFDAPVRYPILYANPNVLSDSIQKDFSRLAVDLPQWAAFVILIEHFFGFLILFPILYFKRGFSNLIQAIKTFDARDWFSVIFISAGGSALGLFFFLISFGLGNPTIAILIQESQPLITIIFAMVLLKERPRKDFWLSLVVAIIGILLLSIPQIWTSEQSFDITGLIAILCTLVAATLWGGSTVFGRILTKKVDYWDLTLLRYIGGFSFLIVFNLLLLNYNSTNINLLGININVFGNINVNPNALILLNIPIVLILGILFVTIFTGGVLPLALYYYGLRMSKAVVAGLAELTFPVLSIIVNEIFLGYGLDGFQILGALILLTDIAILTYNSTKVVDLKAVESKVISPTID